MPNRFTFDFKEAADTIVLDVVTPTANSLTAINVETESQATAAAQGAAFPDKLQTSTYPSRKQLTSSASADTFGAWVELVADVGTSKKLIYMVIVDAGASGNSSEIEIGEGAPAAESAISLLSLIAGIQLSIPLSRTLTDNARLSARIKRSNAAAQIATVGVMIS